MGLSKSKYTKFCQCPKMLWMQTYKPEEEVMDEGAMARFEEGNKVGDLAMRLFGEYTDVTTTKADGKLDLEAMIKKTHELIDKGSDNICEASFSFNSEEFGLNYCAVDILRKTENGYAIYEVKSSTGSDDSKKNSPSVLEKYAIDIAYQKWVLIKCGINVTGCYLVRLNANYYLEGDLNEKELFHITDMNAVVDKKYALVESNVRDAARIQNTETEPEKPLGKHCKSPYACAFWNYCSRNLPIPSVFDLYDGRNSIKLYEQGKVGFDQLNDSDLTDIQKLQVKGITHIDKDGIKQFLSKISYPLYFLDFESMMYAIPQFQKTKPYQQIPFQYSLHYMQTEGGELEHKEFLAESGKDPMRKLAEQLCKDIPLDVCTIAYNKTFECGRIKELALMFDDLKDHLLNIASHIVDLLDPFKDGFYYLPAMGSSFSIKSVLPALYPDEATLNYHNLAGQVQNGGEAMNLFPKIKDMAPEEQKKARESLLKYCELDTYAMVKVLEKLKDAVK